MSDKDRRARFKAWFAATYGTGRDARAKFMAATARLGGRQLSKGRVSQLFDPREPFGEPAARNLGERLGLGEDWFLVDRPEFGQGAKSSKRGIGPPPAQPPEAFKDRHEVSESDWALLQDIKTAMESPRGAAQVEDLRKEAAAMAAYASRFYKAR